MQTKARVLLLSVVLSGASVGFAAPMQAHHIHDDVWPDYGMTGLILLHSYSPHHHHGKHRYYGDYRPHYKHRRDQSYGRKEHYRNPVRGERCRKHKHRRIRWDDD